MMMSTFSGLTVPEGQKEQKRITNREVVKFKYIEVVSDHYKYRGEVGNKNDLRNDVRTNYRIVLESSRGTTWLPIRVFIFYRMY